MILAHVLDGLRCSDCGTLNALWFDPVRASVECRECGHGALTVPDEGSAA